MIKLEFAKQGARLRTYVILAVMVGIPIALPLIFKVGAGAGEHGGSFVSLARESGLNMAMRGAVVQLPTQSLALRHHRIHRNHVPLPRGRLAVQRASGAVMVAMGILIFTGALIDIFRYVQAFNLVL